MPTADTSILTIRVPNDIADAVRAEAEQRGLSVNAVLSATLRDRFLRARGVRKSDKNVPETYELEPD